MKSSVDREGRKEISSKEKDTSISILQGIEIFDMFGK